MSDAVLDALKKIAEQQDETQRSVVAAQEMNTKMEGGMTNMQEAIQKAAEDAGKAMQGVQDAESTIKSIQDTAKYLETSIARMGDGSGGGESEIEEKAHQETCRYLRTGDEMSEDVSAAVVQAMTEKMYHGLTDPEKDHEIKTLTAGINTDVGYFIRPERSAKMIQRIFESSPMRRFSDVVTTATDALEFIIDDQEADSGGWVGEVSARGDTGTPSIGKLTIPVHEQFAQPLATQKMLDDAGFNIEAWLSNKVSDKMIRVENTAFVVGDGSQKPKGFLSYEDWTTPGEYERNKLEQIASTGTTAMVGDDFKNMQNSMIEEYQSSAIWAMKRASFLPVITLKDNSGRYIFESRFIDNRDEMRLLGKEVVFMNDMPDVATSALAYAYANFGMGYTIVDRIGFRVLRDPYTSKPFVKFYTTKRTGGAVTNFESIKIASIT